MHYFAYAKLKIVLSIFDGRQRVSEMKPHLCLTDHIVPDEEITAG